MSTPRPTPLSSYLIVYAVLIILATMSLGYSLLHLRGGLVVSLVVASVKAMAVLWIFMHLREQRISSALAMLLAVLWIALLGGIMVTDVVTRRTFPERPRPTGEDGFYQR